MATLTNSSIPNYPAKTSGLAGNEKTIVATHELEAALALNDLIPMVTVPANCTITRVILGTDDLDSNGTPTLVLDVGDGDDTDRFIDGATVGQTGGITDMSDMAMTGFGYHYDSEDTIDVLVQAAPATGATSGTITLTVSYVMD